MKMNKINEAIGRNSRRGYRGGMSGGDSVGWWRFMQYDRNDTKRDLADAFGYPDCLEFGNFQSMYEQLGLAAAGIELIPSYCWQSLPKITDSSEDSEFSQAVNTLSKKHNLLQVLKELDVKQRIGRYAGVIIISKETSDDPKPETVLNGMGIDGLLKLVPVNEAQARASKERIEDLTSPMFGDPEYYEYRSNVPGDLDDSNKTGAQINPSRIYVFTEGVSNGIYGMPALKSVYYSLMDWEKLRGSFAEGFFKNSKQRFALNAKDNTTASAILSDNKGQDGKSNKEKFDENMDDFASGVDSAMFLSGMEVTMMQSALADPTGGAGMILQDIAAGLMIEKTILVGFETGERSSGENKLSFLQKMKSRQETDCNRMIRGLLNQLAEFKVIPKPKGDIEIEWNDLLALSDSEILDNQKKMADINKTLIDSNMDPVYSSKEIREEHPNYEGEVDIDYSDGTGGERDGEDIINAE